MGFEMGPYRAQSDGSLQLNSQSWNQFATVVFIEQPVGVGFSFSDVTKEMFNDTVSATDNYAFLQAFFKLYPQYQTLPLFLTSESYGGCYAPQLSSQILNGPDTRLKNQFVGFAVGNPVVSITQDTANFAQIMQLVQASIWSGHALIPTSLYTTYVDAGCAALTPNPQGNCDALYSELVKAAGQCFAENACGDDIYADPYGNATLGAATIPYNDQTASWTKYLNLPAVQQAIHAVKPSVPWDTCADIDYDVTWPSSVPDYETAFLAGKRVLIFSGDVDVSTCPFASTQVFVDYMTTRSYGEITQPWTAWNVVTAGNTAQLGGYIEHHRGFTFATLFAAGHESPGYQPYAGSQLIRAFVQNKLDDLTSKTSEVKAIDTSKTNTPTTLTQGSILRSKIAMTLKKMKESKE